MSVRDELQKRVNGGIHISTPPVLAWSRGNNLFIATKYLVYQVTLPKKMDKNAMEVDSDSIEIFHNESKHKASVEERAKLTQFDSEALEMCVGSDKLLIVSKDEGSLRLSWICLNTWRFRHGEKFSNFVEGEGCWIMQVNSRNLKQDFSNLCGSSFPPCDVVIIGFGGKIVCFPFVGEKFLSCIKVRDSAGFKSKLDFQRTFLNLQIEQNAVHLTSFSSLLSLLKTENVNQLKQKYLVDDISTVEYCGNTFFLLTKTGDLWKYSSTSSAGDWLEKTMIMKNVRSFTAVQGQLTLLTFTYDIYSADFVKSDLRKNRPSLTKVQTSEILKEIFNASKNIQVISEARKEQKAILNQLKLLTLSVQNGVEMLQPSLSVEMENGHPKLSAELLNTSETAIQGRFWSLQVTFAYNSQDRLAAVTLSLPDSLPSQNKVAFSCDIPTVSPTDFPLNVVGTLLFNMSTLVSRSIVQSLPVFKYEIGILQCLDVIKELQSTNSGQDEAPVWNLSQKEVNRKSFQAFLMHKNKWRTSQSYEALNLENSVLIPFSNLGNLNIVRKLWNCKELNQKRTLICNYGGSVLKLENQDKNIKVASLDEELLKAVHQELEETMKSSS